MMSRTNGLLIAFEGLDQSGKQTQAESLSGWLSGHGRRVRTASFPDYETPIGREIGSARAGEREYGPDVMQLLYVTNRYEWKREIERSLEAGMVVLCDRYLASSVAYGEAQGLDPAWLVEIQKYLPQPDLTVVLDIAPETAVRRKAANRDRFEQDLALLQRVRESYRRQAEQPAWIRIDGERERPAVAADVASAVARLLEPR
jgi:dTMP kinase